MSSSEQILVKKEEWGDGEWLNEPGLFDMVEFEYKEHKCILRRSFSTGSWCGYFSVSKNSRWVTDYDELEVHGGVTFSEFDGEGNFWIGFYCGHYEDYSPRLEKMIEIDGRTIIQEMTKDLHKSHKTRFENFISKRQQVYRTVDYARGQLLKMVDQAVTINNDNQCRYCCSDLIDDIQV